MRRAAALFGFTLCLTVGCEHKDRFASPDTAEVAPKPMTPPRSAFLSVSNLSPAAGSIVVVAGTVSVGNDLSLGSFRVRLSYDSTMLRFVDEVPAAGMMRVVNPRGGEVVVAGAASAGSSDGRLFALRFSVVRPAGLNSLMLIIDELNDAAFVDQRPTVVRASRLLLDTALVAGKGVP